MLRGMIQGIFSYIFPARCLLCGDHVLPSTLGVCSGCASRIRPVPRPACPVCGNTSGTEDVCMGCLTDPPPYDRLMSAALFDGPLKDMIHAFKYADATYYKRFLARLLYDLVRDELAQCDMITFVPLHWSRMVARGYNQAALMAQGLSRMSRIPLRYGVLRKTRATPTQVGLSRSQRKRNLSDTFQARGVAGRAVLVVDDVVTTGHTALEVSRALKKAGARRVLFASAGRIVA